MAQSSKKQTKQHPTEAKQPPRQGPQARRALSKKKREASRQRLVITTTGVAVGLALLALLVGVIYDQFWYPSQAIAQVNDETLTRREYWQQQRYQLIDQIAQNLEMLQLFGDQEFASQFAGRSPAINDQVEAVRAQPLNEQFLEQWQNNELLRQGAEEFSISVSDAEINQEIAAAMGPTFLPITPTETLTPTAATGALTATDALTPTRAPTVTPGGPTPTPSATSTPIPTETPQPTPQPAEATEQARQIAAAIYEQFTSELEQVEQNPNLTEEDMLEALRNRYEQRILQRKVQEHLVPTDEFTPTDEPEQVQARQIFLEVEVPDDASEEEHEEAYEEVQEDAEALVEDLRDDADFAALAEEESDDIGSRDQGGDMGFFGPEGTLAAGTTLPPEVVDTAFALEVGEISDPVRSQFGWHIIEVTDQQVPDVEQQLRTARNEALEEWLEEQREQATVQRFPEPTATPTPLVPMEPTTTPAPTYLPGPPTPQPAPPPGEGGALPEPQIIPVQP